MPITNKDGPPQRRYDRTTKLLSYLSAAWCGFSIPLLGAGLTAVSVNQINEVLLTSKFTRSDDIGGFVGALFADGVLGYFGVVIFGVASGRFLLRALPPAMSDRGGRGRSMAVMLYATSLIVFYIFSVLLMV